MAYDDFNSMQANSMKEWPVNLAKNPLDTCTCVCVSPQARDCPDRNGPYNQGKKKEDKLAVLGPDIFWWGGGSST